MKISSTLSLPFIPLKFFLCMVIGLSVITGSPQNADYVIKTFNVEQGIAHPNVRSIIKDSTGFLWIATFDGLSRFDGNEFINYRHSPEDSGSIRPNDVRKLCIDRKNRLWILNDGATRLDPASEKFIVYPRTLYKPPFQKYIPLMTSDVNGMIWVLMSNELLVYNEANDRFIPVPFIESADLGKWIKYASSFNFDEKGYLWIMGDDEVYCCQISRRSDLIPISIRIIAKYKIINKESVHFYAAQLEQAVTQSDHGIFLFTNVGLFQLHQDINAFIPVSVEPQRKWFDGSRSFAWFDTKAGIRFWDAKKKELNCIIQRDMLFLETAFIDTDESWWYGGFDIAQNGIGLRHAIPESKSFHHYFQKFEGQKTAVFAIYREPNGGFWIGNRSKEYLVHLTAAGFPDRMFPCYQAVNSGMRRLGSTLTQVRAISQDAFGNVWIGFLHDFLYYLPKNNPKFFQVFPDPKVIEFPHKRFFNRQILQLKDGKLLVGGDAGMILINPVNHTVLNHFSFPPSYMGMYAAFQDGNDNIWIGNGGSVLRKFDKALNFIDSVKFSDEFYNLECIAGNTDTLWIASMGGGLIRFITKGRSFKFYSTRNGLANNYAYHLFPDKHNNLWISTNEGLSAFNPRTEIFTNFSESDGLKIKEFNADAGFMANDGELFFGGMGGFVGFYPDSIYLLNQKAAGKLLITNVNVSGMKKIFLKPVYTLDTIPLGQGDNNLQLTFDCLDFNFPEKINYRYRIEGVDDNWNLAKANNRHANYAGLLPGFHSFVVEVSDKKGNWSVQKTVIINIPAYLYQEIWFKLSIAIFLISLIALLLWMKYKQVRLVNLKRQETLRMQSLQSQLNPHFIFNSLNSISYLISNKPQEVADQYVADFASLMRSFLDNSSRDFILLREEIESVEHYLALEHMRLAEKFDYRVECIPELETEAIEVIPSLIQPFIENAIWHGVGLLKGRKGTIVVRFNHVFKNAIMCTVEDDGIGRARADSLKSTDYRKRQSKGVSLVLDRLKIINSLYKTDHQVVIDDLKPQEEEPGTKVIIPIPVRLT